MSDESFTKVGGSDEKMYGPTGVIVSGYSMNDRLIILDLLEKLFSPEIPRTTFLGRDQADLTILDAFSLEDRFGLENESSMPNAILMSGLTERGLKAFMTAFRSTGLPRPLWATLTPYSEKWPFGSCWNIWLRKQRLLKKGEGKLKHPGTPNRP